MGAVVAVTMAALKKLHGLCWRWQRLAGLAAVAGFVALLMSLWHPVFRFTRLLQVDVRNEASALAVLREQPVAFSPDGGYDGQYYAQIACDPSLRSPELRTAIDSLPYRARRILMPAAAWALGLGRSAWSIQIFPWLNIACWFALAALLWTLLEADRGWRGLVAWAGVMFSAGVLASVRYSLTDLPALVLFLFAMRAGVGRPRSAAAWLAGALLCRETALVGAWGLCPKPWGRPGGLMRIGARLGLALLPLGMWLGYIRWQVGPPGGGLGNFAWPVSGLIARWREVFSALHTLPDPWLAWATLLATAATTAQLVFLMRCVLPADRWWRVGAGFVILTLLLGRAVWEGTPGASPRVLLPLLLACNALVIHRRRATVWLLLVNLSVPVGLMEMLPLPDVRELAAVRAHGSGAVLRAEAGCYGPERSGSSCWVWAGQEAQWKLRSWTGGREVDALLSAEVRAMDERELVVEWAGGELWRGRVGSVWTPVRLPPLPVKDGQVVLTLRSAQPPVREGPGSDARLFSVCLLNPRFELRPAPTGRSGQVRAQEGAMGK